MRPAPDAPDASRRCSGGNLKGTETMKQDIYQTVTDRIIAELEQGAAPWIKPWQTSGEALADMPHNATSGRPYSGVNVLMLWLTACAQGYGTPAFVTFKQAKEAGGHVRKGEHGHTVVYVNAIEREREGEGGEPERERIPFLKAYTVFNLDQCDGLDGLKPERIERPALLANDAFQGFVSATRATIRHQGNRAFYAPSPDLVQLPHPLDFRDHASYQATLLHELGHWTGAESRLDRDLRNRFGSRAYAAEELVAELTAAFLCAHLGIRGELRHAGYIGNWLELLRADKRAVFTAASKASTAADYLRSFSEAEEMAQAA